MDVKRDLHIHSYYSDGDYSPEEIVDLWEKEGYEIIAITDHDGIGGSKVAHKYAKGKSIIVIPGIEFDSEDELGDDIHILGYNIDFDNPKLVKTLSEVNGHRARRNDEMVKKLNELGYDISTDDLVDIIEQSFIGKITFAKALINKGYATSKADAFKKILSLPEIKNMPKTVLKSKEVIALIHEAGGFAVLAHPMEQYKSGEDTQEFYKRMSVFLNKFVEYGIDGVECKHPSANDAEEMALRQFAARNNIGATTGSDYHGPEQREFKGKDIRTGKCVF